MGPGRIELPSDFMMTSRPRVALRGHQLGYRPKTNSYDAWDLPQWEQYIRDLAVFGTNAVELVPPRTDDDADSPHFPRPPLEMMVGMSRLLDEYGLDVWVWFPAMDADYTDPAKVESALKEWDAVFRALPRLDAVFVPGGDPGHTQPKVLLAFLEKVDGRPPQVAPEGPDVGLAAGFNGVWMDEFLGLVKAEPIWLTGSSSARRCGRRWSSFARPFPRDTPFAAIPTSPTPTVPAPRGRLGPRLRRDRGPRGDQPQTARSGRGLPSRTATIPWASSPIPKGATTTSTRSSGAHLAGTPTPMWSRSSASTAAT